MKSQPGIISVPLMWVSILKPLDAVGENFMNESSEHISTMPKEESMERANGFSTVLPTSR